MEVILKKDVDHLGFIDDIVNVKAGYARNFLIPKKLAVYASQSEKKILEEETQQFMIDLHHRATAPTIRQLTESCQRLKAEELERLFNKIPQSDPNARDEISRAFDRFINKLLHPPLDSLRKEAHQGTPHSLLDAFKRLFKLKD